MIAAAQHARMFSARTSHLKEGGGKGKIARQFYKAALASARTSMPPQRSPEDFAAAELTPHRLMGTRCRMRLTLLLLWLVAMALGGWLLAAAPAPEVLILISRSPSDTWAVAELDGMQRALQGARPPVPAAVEYMDVQATSGAEYDADLVKYYGAKFAGRHFRLVLAADEPALKFIIAHRDELFPSAQAVFCGVTKFEDSLKAQYPWITGVLENADPGASLRLALALQPNLQRLVILDDRTQSGRGNKKRIEEEMPDVAQKVKLQIIRADTARALFTAVENLPPDTAVLMTRAAVARRMGPELLARCPVPIYGQRLPTHLGAMLGGAMIDGERHGEAAARLGLRLLAGESAANIPVVPGLPTRVVVEHEQMARFHLPFSALPPGTEILNRPQAVWEVYPRATRAALGVLIFLAGLAGWLTWALIQKRRSAIALKRSLSLLHATLDASADGVLVVDREGETSGFNRRFLEIWGISQEIIEHREDGRLVKRVMEQLKDPAGFLERIRELRTTPEAESFETLEFLDGRLIERRSRPQRLDADIVGRVWTFVDITARHDAEEANRRLESQVAHSHRLEALGTLAGGIAHDFNNLLTAILGYTHLGHSALPEEHPVREDLEAVLQASERARDLVQQILTFSRKSPFERKAIQLDGVVREVARMLRATIPATVEISCEIGEAGGTVLADSSRVHQAILNLGTNAAHAMHGHPGSITVRLDEVAADTVPFEEHPTLRGKACACVTVSDTGHGMDAETLRRVFDPFFTTKKPGEGTGLGLAMVHGIMQNHEGVVTMESTPGVGTTARLYFPYIEADVSFETEPTLMTALGENRRVLLVDDEQVVLRVGEQMLQRLGFEVTACGNPTDALGLLQNGSGSFDAVLTDLNMPQMSGLEFAAAIRLFNTGIAIVLATGYLGEGGVEERAAELSIGEIVTKPYTPVMLVTGLQRAIEKAVARRTGSCPEPLTERESEQFPPFVGNPALS
jgi:two-component system cell cycle sensor histidine kinase/response regulator CckA